MRRLRRSGLAPLVLITVVAVGAFAGVLATGSGPQLGLDLEGGFSVTLQPTEDVDNDVLDQAIAVIRSRVDAIGVAEPEITRQGDTIVVNLPGVEDSERALELVGTTAELRFRPVLSTFPGSIEDLQASTTTTSTTTSTTTTAAPTTTAPDAGSAATAPSTTAPAETTTTTAAPGLEVTPREQDVADQPVTLTETDDGEVVATYRLGPTMATGEIVETARAQINQGTGEWFVSLTIDDGSGIEQFNQAAATCFGGSPECPTGALAIVLDSNVVSAPQIQQPSFERDQIQISGSFSEGEAKDLALVLRYGSLPVSLETQQTREVSATLGESALEAGIVSGIVGLALVALYMIGYYRLLGLVAIGSLAVSGLLLWAVVSWLGETQGLALTLAGITGIIVSIGIAVDSNVVFYEHLKEDVSRGRSVRSAVSGSFTQAFSTIIKADVASLIGAGLLYWLTIGPVRGFAFFLGLSTILDIVASYLFMRPLVVRMARSARFNDRPGLLGLRAREVAT